MGKPQPPAYWHEDFVVALIDSFVTSLEFQDSNMAYIEMNENSNGFIGTFQLDRKENFAHSLSRSTQTALIVKSPLLEKQSKKFFSSLQQISFKKKQFRILQCSRQTFDTRQQITI